jgi:hypothetical protein
MCQIYISNREISAWRSERSFFMNNDHSYFSPMVGLITFFSLVVFVAPGWTQGDPVIYPSKGQSQQQLDKDKGECYIWAKNQSGFDPMAQPTASTPPPQTQASQSSPIKGAARGGLLGVAVGAIAGDAGKGAAIGAVTGGLLGGMKRRDQTTQNQNQEQQWAQQQASHYAQGRSEYNRNFSACMKGRNYSVN